ncbi:MAG: sulfite oxidase-like oxidoreductase [Dehalococcoidia bacterium]|nr:sulfite oxidase-like oxidoreductase [Dehalococcoidia bacterium]
MLKKLGHQTKITQKQDGLNVPPGQYVTQKFPEMTYGASPGIDLKAWRLRVFGLVEQEAVFTWEEFLALPQMALTRDFHCVTQWSSMDNLWEGVPFRDVMQRVSPRTEAKYVMVRSYGGYATNLPLDVLMEEDVLLAHRHQGEPLEAAHGGPMRLVVPSRYGWKSAKWVNGLELMAQDKPGFWEQLGYHNNADPWKEERFG